MQYLHQPLETKIHPCDSAGNFSHAQRAVRRDLVLVNRLEGRSALLHVHAKTTSGFQKCRFHREQRHYHKPGNLQVGTFPHPMHR